MIKSNPIFAVHQRESEEADWFDYMIRKKTENKEHVFEHNHTSYTHDIDTHATEQN